MDKYLKVEGNILNHVVSWRKHLKYLPTQIRCCTNVGYNFQKHYVHSAKIKYILGMHLNFAKTFFLGRILSNTLRI